MLDGSRKRLEKKKAPNAKWLRTFDTQCLAKQSLV